MKWNLFNPTRRRLRTIKPLAATLVLLVLASTVASAMVLGTASSASASATLTFSPIADAYVDGRNPNTNFGSARDLKADNSPIQEAYLKFQLSGLTGTVTSAKLRVYTTNPSASAGSVAKMSNTGWSESAATYNNRPAIDGPVLSTLGAVNNRTWYEFDVTGAIAGNGTVSLGLRAGTRNGIAYAAREAGGNAPQLVVTLATPTSTPTPVLTATPQVATPTPTATRPAATATPVPPTATATKPAATATPVPPTATRTATSVPPTATAIPATATPIRTATPAPTTPAGSSPRPYAATSPWNTPISPNPAYDPNSALRVARISGYFASDPNAWTFPIYRVTNATPLRSVTVGGTFTSAVNNDSQVTRQGGVTVSVPVPQGALPSSGSDAHLLVWNTDTGDEWGFWQFRTNADGSLGATNGYHYNTNWDAVPPPGPFLSRGSGIPNLAGVIRPWEIAQGHIDHALAFAYPSPTSQYVYPAINSDGSSTNVYDMPEGTRLQLDPALTDADFTAWGLSPAGKIIAQAMQQYGLIITDHSGTPQLFVEDYHTAAWNGTVANGTVSKIPYSRLKVLAP